MAPKPCMFLSTVPLLCCPLSLAHKPYPDSGRVDLPKSSHPVSSSDFVFLISTCLYPQDFFILRGQTLPRCFRVQKFATLTPL